LQGEPAELFGQHTADIRGARFATVEHHTGAHKTIEWKLVQCMAPRIEVAWGVNVRAGVRAQADLSDLIAVGLVQGGADQRERRVAWLERQARSERQGQVEQLHRQ
jgi:hypothetical protein